MLPGVCAGAIRVLLMFMAVPGGARLPLSRCLRRRRGATLLPRSLNDVRVVSPEQVREVYSRTGGVPPPVGLNGFRIPEDPKIYVNAEPRSTVTPRAIAVPSTCCGWQRHSCTSKCTRPMTSTPRGGCKQTLCGVAWPLFLRRNALAPSAIGGLSRRERSRSGSLNAGPEDFLSQHFAHDCGDGVGP